MWPVIKERKKENKTKKAVNRSRSLDDLEVEISRQGLQSKFINIFRTLRKCGYNERIGKQINREMEHI